MLTMTEQAGTRLAQLLGEGNDQSVARIVHRKRRMRLRRGHVRPEDTTFAHGGRVVLVLDADIARRLTSRTLDIRETVAGPRLSLRRA